MSIAEIKCLVTICFVATVCFTFIIINVSRSLYGYKEIARRFPVVTISRSISTQETRKNEYNTCIEVYLCIGNYTPMEVFLSLEQMSSMYTWLDVDGHAIPESCISNHRAAVIVPLRNREEHFLIFLRNLHPYLKLQHLDYGIFVIEQVQNQTFNKAKLMNVGFVESLKYYDWNCFVFHDVDLLPMNSGISYNCLEKQVRHMAVAVGKERFRGWFLGGVAGISKTLFEKFNGYSNQYWGWGGEDNEMGMRDRNEHLKAFLKHMHRFLKQEKLEYQIFIVEQTQNQTFNRAKLMNVGFVEARKVCSQFHCFVFHDVDLLPFTSSTGNAVYNCSENGPVHLASANEKFNYSIDPLDRNEHLKVFLKHMHPFLKQQKLEYQIFIVEQIQNQTFNRAKLINVGFVEARKLCSQFHSFVFHDVDLLPLTNSTENAIYNCSENGPVHLASGSEKFNYRLPYGTYFGGVCMLTADQFLRINGFSNRFWGWGGEDDEAYRRFFYIRRFFSVLRHFHPAR